MMQIASLTWIEINKEAFEHNAMQLRKIVGPHTIIAPVLKSNAYGHGLHQMQQLCQENKHFDWTCVVSLSDGITLREKGFKKPILVFGYCDVDPFQAVLHAIDVVAFDIHLLKALSKAACSLGRPAYVHIKIDTGMSRLGIFAQQVLQLYEYADSLPGIMVRGICSHLARAGAQDLTITQQQLERFAHAISTLEQRGYEVEYKHMAASAGLFVTQQPAYNFVRPGRQIYGLWTSEASKQRAHHLYPELTIKPVMTWKCRIVQIKTIPKDQYISYDGTYKTVADTTVAILPVGYYEGYSRNLSNKGLVYLNGHYAPIVGIVCMNLMVIDITHIPDVTLDTPVILVGDYPHITIYEIAERANVVPLEFLTGISPTIPRIVV